jgi:hypothetical protein
MTLNEFYQSDWFKERPLAVQELFKKYPVNKQWYMRIGGDQDQYYGVRIFGIDEGDEITFRIMNDGFMKAVSRQVFGVKPEDLISEEDVPKDKISWETDPVLNIT